MKDTSSSNCISLFFCGVMALHIPDNRIILGHLNISIWFLNIKSYFSCVWLFYLIFLNCSFKCSCLSGWIYLLSLFFFFFFLFFLWLLLNEAKLKDSGVLWLKTAVDMCLLCCWQETETWQLVCVSLWEHTWICFMMAWTRRQFYFPYFSIAKKFVLIHFLYCILWQLCRWDKFMKVQEGPRAGKYLYFLCENESCRGDKHVSCFFVQLGAYYVTSCNPQPYYAHTNQNQT